MSRTTTRAGRFPLLLDDRWAPITDSMGFVEAPIARIVAAMISPPPDVEGEIRCRSVDGPLSQVLAALLPLTMPIVVRTLLVPTSQPWTALFNNSKLGTDAFAVLSWLARQLSCRCVRITATPDAGGRYGASMFELLGPAQTDLLNVVRSIHAMNDGGRWRFGVSGTPQPFEEPDRYTARRLRDRLPFDVLDRYCGALGIRPFDEGFYLPREQPAALIERVLPIGLQTKEFTLAEVQAGFGRGGE
jgi:hypothetical protein